MAILKRGKGENGKWKMEVPAFCREMLDYRMQSIVGECGFAENAKFPIHQSINQQIVQSGGMEEWRNGRVEEFVTITEAINNSTNQKITKKYDSV